MSQAALKAHPAAPDEVKEAVEKENVKKGLTPDGAPKEPVDPKKLVERKEPRTLLWLALIAGLVFLFFFFAKYAVGDDDHTIDNQILLMFRNPDNLAEPIGPHWLYEFVRDFTALSGWPVLTIFTAIIGGYLAMRKKWGTLLLLLAAVFGESFIVESIKGFFGRERPTVVPHLLDVSNYSFPSGHSASAMAVYLTLAVIISRATKEYRARLYVITVAIIFACSIAVSRLYLGVHYPSDVAAGLALGAAWAAIVWLAAYYIDHWFGSFWKGTRS